MQTESLKISLNKSGAAAFTRLIVSLRRVVPNECEVAIGYPGLPNVNRVLKNGDAVLYETTQDGIVEVRAVGLSYANDTVEFLITQVSPRAGLLAGAIDTDPNNTPFSDTEIARIAESIVLAKHNLEKGAKLEPEQFQLLSRKLDEIQEASERLGRKDWINYVAGSLTSLCMSAAFAPEVTKGVFQAINVAFGWLFTNAVLLLQ